MDVAPLLLMWLESLFKSNPGTIHKHSFTIKTVENDTTQRMYTSNFKHFCFYCQMDAVFFLLLFCMICIVHRTARTVYIVHIVCQCCMLPWLLHGQAAITITITTATISHRESKRIRAKRQHNKKEKKKTQKTKGERNERWKVANGADRHMR